MIHRRYTKDPSLVSGLGRGWRHSFDLLVTKDQLGFTVFETNGERHHFHDTASMGIGSHDNAAHATRSGMLLRNGVHHRWSRADGTVVEFTGSLPTSIIHLDGTFQRLNYRRGQLVSVDRQTSNSQVRRQYEFAYDQKRLSHVRQSGKRWYEYGFDHSGQLSLKPARVAPSIGDSASNAQLSRYGDDLIECVVESPAQTRCDTESVAPPHGFHEPTASFDSIRIDVRPSSCNSYFSDFHGTTRGQQIEQGLVAHDRYDHLNHTVRSFPIIDFYGDGVARVIRSRDLTSPTLSARSGQPLFNRLIQDGREIQRKFLDPLAIRKVMTVEEGGRTTRIHRDDVKQVVLEVIVRHNTVTADQITQIEKARRTLQEQFNITLQVIEIP